MGADSHGAHRRRAGVEQFSKVKRLKYEAESSLTLQ
jgi:hypothetical protein